MDEMFAIKCQNCGGPMYTHQAKRSFECAYCGAVIPWQADAGEPKSALGIRHTPLTVVDGLLKLTHVSQLERPEDPDWYFFNSHWRNQSVLEHLLWEDRGTAQEFQEATHVSIPCPFCGASFEGESTQRVFECPSCGNKIGIADLLKPGTFSKRLTMGVGAEYVPEQGIPCEISPQQARANALQLVRQYPDAFAGHDVEDAIQKGVRTESWTAGRSGLEVRMYSREKVELFLLATEDGMGPTAAAKFAGVSVGAAKKWATGHLPHSYTGARCRIGARKPPRKEASLGPDKSIYAPPATGPLAGLNEDQIENLLLRAVLADLKAEGWDPASISNRSKCELGERLRRATALPLRSITGFLRISKSSYEYWRPRVAAPRDRDADIRDRVVRIFREGSGCWGYRTVWARLRREGVRASEKRVARVMREEGLEVVYNKRRARGYSSYAGEVSKAPENLVNRRFRADEPNRLWLTDITEFRLPGGEKVYLSPIVDCFDGMPVAWSIGLHPDKRLANSSLLKACAARPAGARTTIHSDRGGHYRWPEWIGICEENGLVRSMSAKGCSPDNSACEGFFGRLKNEFFHYRDWEGVTAEEFMGRLEAYLVYYREERIKKSLGWLSPMEYRRKLVEWEG